MSDKAAEITPRPAVPTLRKAFAILDLIAREGRLGFTPIQRRLDLPKSSTHQLLKVLSELGALDLGPDGRYGLGTRIGDLGAAATAQQSIELIAAPHLHALARNLRLTCHLGRLDGLELVYLSKVEWTDDIRINSWVGKRLQPHRSALGKAIFAGMDDDTVERFAATLDWGSSITTGLHSAAALTAEIAEIRRRGFAVDDEEVARGLRCVAAAIIDSAGRTIAAIGASGTLEQIEADDYTRIGEQVKSAARAIAADIRR